MNVTARIADLSSGCQILGTAEVAHAAERLGIEVIDLGSFELRNVSQAVEVFEIDCGHDVRGHTVDPVCRMRVKRSRASGSVRYAGREYLFCSLDCLGRFAADPTRYVPAA